MSESKNGPIATFQKVSHSALQVLLQRVRRCPSPYQAAMSLYVLLYNVSIAGGAFIGTLGIDLLGTLASTVFGAAFRSLAVTASRRRNTLHHNDFYR